MAGLELCTALCGELQSDGVIYGGHKNQKEPCVKKNEAKSAPSNFIPFNEALSPL